MRVPRCSLNTKDGRIELTIRNLYDGLPVRRVAPCGGLEVRRTGRFISAARLSTAHGVCLLL